MQTIVWQCLLLLDHEVVRLVCVYVCVCGVDGDCTQIGSRCTTISETRNVNEQCECVCVCEWLCECGRTCAQIR